MAKTVQRLPRAIEFTDEHHEFRAMVKRFLETEIRPHLPRWQEQGMVDREAWLKAGELGIICPNVSEKYGGAGTDFLFNAIVIEELGYTGTSEFFLMLHSDMVAPYIVDYGSEEQKQKYLPDVVSGKKILAISMTEPGAGSDLANLQTRAEDKGDHYLLNGSKTFISNGQLADLNIVCARTGEGQGGISLFLVESDWPGYSRGRNLQKIGLKAQDTSEIHFDDVMVPKENLLGRLNSGFRYLMQKLQQERLVIGISNQACAEAALDLTVQYVHERTAFGKKIGQFQNTRYKLADMLVEQEMSRAFVDQVLLGHLRGDKRMIQASMTKLACSEMLNRHVNTCLQMFGGYGYMLEYPIARAYLDARVQTIFAGTSEIMREIVAKAMGL